MLVKKRILYRNFIKYRTKELEFKYKKYKNKLTNIMRVCKKNYYNNLLEKNKDNVKGIWNTINTIITKGINKFNYPEYFNDNDIQSGPDYEDFGPWGY